MLSKIGRLDSEDKKELSLLNKNILALVNKNKIEEVQKELKRIGMTQNYFIREFVGEELALLDKDRKLYDIITDFIDNKFYGSRAIALFYLCKIHQNDVKKIFSIIEKTFETTPWEVETIISDLWKQNPDFMKKNMLEWIESDNSKKRALSFHGMENISNSDPNYIMNFISKAIDDETIDVQKKITHILTQIARENPIVVYPYVRQWLSDADDKRIKTIWVSMKKLANIVNQRARRDDSEQFVRLTEQTIDDWTHDENEKVVKMGEKLSYILSRRFSSSHQGSHQSSHQGSHNSQRKSSNQNNHQKRKSYNKTKRY